MMSGASMRIQLAKRYVVSFAAGYHHKKSRLERMMVGKGMVAFVDCRHPKISMMMAHRPWTEQLAS
jgi:hypothetical protein